MEKTRLEQPAPDHPVTDLHDSIQQQVFALAMHVGTLKLLLQQDAEAALRNVHEIEQLVQQVQIDLNMIRRELHQEHRSSLPG